MHLPTREGLFCFARFMGSKIWVSSFFILLWAPRVLSCLYLCLGCPPWCAFVGCHGAHSGSDTVVHNPAAWPVAAVTSAPPTPRSYTFQQVQEHTDQILEVPAP